MKVLSIGGDPNLLRHGSEAQERQALQAGAVEQLDVFVWPHAHSAAEIIRAARANHYDVVTAQDPFWRGILAWRVARKTGARLNLQVHADLEGQSFTKRVLARFMLPKADTIRVVSERIKKQVEALGVRGHIAVLPIFIDVSRVIGAPRTVHPRFKKIILWYGRFEKEKDPLRALEVLREVRMLGIDAGLVMLGTGSLESKLHEAAAGLPVEFLGWVEPREYLAMADVVLATSPYESYGATVVEALSAGVPVVSLDVGIAREAGARIAGENTLGSTVASVLKSGERGALKLALLSREDWARAWKASL